MWKRRIKDHADLFYYKWKIKRDKRGLKNPTTTTIDNNNMSNIEQLPIMKALKQLKEY